MNIVKGHGRTTAARRIVVVMAATALAGSTWVGVAGATDGSYGTSCVTYNYYFEGDAGSTTTTSPTTTVEEEESTETDPLQDGAAAVGDAVDDGAGAVGDAVKDGAAAVGGAAGANQDDADAEGNAPADDTNEDTGSEGAAGAAGALVDAAGLGIVRITYTHDEPKHYKPVYYAPVNCFKDYHDYKQQPTKLVATQVKSVPKGGVNTGDGSLAD